MKPMKEVIISEMQYQKEILSEMILTIEDLEDLENSEAWDIAESMMGLVEEIIDSIEENIQSLKTL